MTTLLGRRILTVLACLVICGSGAKGLAQSDLAEESTLEAGSEKSEEAIDYKKLKSPVPYSKRSIARGKMIYRRYCTECHGLDGKALMDVVADATNLTEPARWRSGTAEGEIFRSISEGAGIDMPPFKFQLQKEEDMWHLVNFIRSLWPEDKRPELQEEPKKSGGDADGDDEASG